MSVFFIILGIVGFIVNANAWFIVPNLAIYVCFGVGGIVLLIQILSALTVRNTVKNSFKRW